MLTRIKRMAITRLGGLNPLAWEERRLNVIGVSFLL
jgi:hypothetical protein